jgi:hypothetical protein
MNRRRRRRRRRRRSWRSRSAWGKGEELKENGFDLTSQQLQARQARQPDKRAGSQAAVRQQQQQ